MYTLPLACRYTAENGGNSRLSLAGMVTGRSTTACPSTVAGVCTGAVAGGPLVFLISSMRREVCSKALPSVFAATRPAPSATPIRGMGRTTRSVLAIWVLPELLDERGLAQRLGVALGHAAGDRVLDPRGLVVVL